MSRSPSSSPVPSAASSPDGVARRIGLLDGRLFWFLCGAALVVRLYFCSRLPRGSADIIRHLYYGWLVWREGLSIADVPLDAVPYRMAMHVWSNIPYSYPVMGLYFFTLLAGIWPTLFMAKIALTAIEAANAWLVWRVTGERWIGLVYWICPVSIWWVSSDGQYEPLQNLFALAAILLLKRQRPVAALAMLAIAIQVKLTAGALLPWMLIEIWRRDRRGYGELARALTGFMLGFLPTLLASFSYPAYIQPFFYTGTLPYNPVGWNPLSPRTIGLNPMWLVWINAATSNATLAILAIGTVRSKDRPACLPAIVFLLFAKFSAKYLYWYWLVWPTMIATVPDPKLRRWLWIAYPFIDIGATLRLFGIGFGSFMTEGYFSPASVFTALHLSRF